MTETESEFEAFLKTRTVLPNGMSDDDKLEPPKALDAIVLKKAREAIHAQQRVNRAPRWATPVAVAATILLCLSIVLNVSLNTNRPTANLQRMTAATAGKASPMPAAPASGNERREGAAEGTISHEAILPEAKVAESYAPRSPVLAEAAKPAQAPTEAQAAPDSASESVSTVATRGYAGTVAARAPAPATREVAASSATGAATNAPSRSAAAPATPTPSVMASAAPPPPAPAAAMPSGSAGEPADQFTSVTVTGARRSGADARTAASSPSTSGTAPSAAATAAAAAASGLDEAVLAKRKATAAPHPKDPKTWLRQIAALRAAGKSEQAEAEMQRFRAIFPAYPAKTGPSTPSEPPK